MRSTEDRITFLLKSFISDYKREDHPEAALNLYQELRSLSSPVLTAFTVSDDIQRVVLEFVADYTDVEDPHAEAWAADALMEKLEKLDRIDVESVS